MSTPSTPVQIDCHALKSQQLLRLFAKIEGPHLMAPSLQKDPHTPTHVHMSLEKRHSTSTTTLAHQPADQPTFMMPSTVHTHMYASVVNAEAAAEAARHALRTAEAVATKAAEAADSARQSAATAVAAEEQALRDVTLCKAAAAIAIEHHASTMRNLLQLPRPQADPKGEYPGAGSAGTPPAPAAPASRAPDGARNRQDALAIAAATAVARACIQQHMDRDGGAAVSQGLAAKPSTMDASPMSEAPQRGSPLVHDHSTFSQEHSRKAPADEAGLQPVSDTGKSVFGPDGPAQDQSRPADIQAAAAATLLALSEAAGTGRTHSAQSHSKPQQQRNTTGSEPEISDALAVAAAAAIANAYSKRQNASPPPQQQAVAPATSSTPGTPGRTHTDGMAAQASPADGAAAAADGTSPQIERKRSRSDYMLSPAAKAGRTASVSAGLPGIPSRAYTSTPPAAPRPFDGSPGNSAAMKSALSADEVTVDTVVDAGDAETGTAAPRQVPYSAATQEGPQALGASAQALISREAWLNEAANYPQHTLAHLPPITILPEAPIASSLALLCRKPAEAEMSAARSKLERVIAGLADVQDAFPYKMESSIYKAFSRELLWFIKTVARSCGFVDRQRLFSPKKLLLRSMSFWRACLAASGADAQHIFFLRDSYLMLIVPGLWVQARVAEGNTPEAPPPGASLLQLRGELLKQSKLFVGFAKNFHRLVPECARPVFAVFAPSTEGVMPELLK